MNAKLPRRRIIRGLATSPLLAITMAAERSAADGKLIALGHQFDALVAIIDHGIETGSEIPWEVLHRSDSVEMEIVGTPAKTIDGLRVKARVACWALLGDLDPTGQSTTDNCIALSIVRDLIRLYDPSLERPNALKKLVGQIESDASNS